jgi:eukaryotic-like serine/threonine-protein kinase
MAGTSQADGKLLAGRYRRIRRLGSGGMASVFLAEDTLLGRPVAIKRLPTEAPEESLQRFRHEARIGASLNHPGLVAVYDSIAEDDGLLIVMEYVEGRSLTELIDEGPLPAARAADIVAQVADALDHAHRSGVVHRDVKPSNILVRDDGVVKLADLGIARTLDASRITATGSVFGTLAYIAPERLRGEPDGPPADVYSLAAVAFESLSGRRAQQATTPAELVRLAGEGPVPELREAWPAAPAAAARLLRGALSPEPERRPGSAGALAEQLAAALGVNGGAGAGVPLDPDRTERLDDDGFPPLPERRERRPAGPLVAAGAIALALLAVAGVLAMSGGDDSGELAQQAADPGRDASANKPEQNREPAAEQPAAAPEPAPEPEPEPDTSGYDPALGASLNQQGFDLINAGDYEAAIPILEQAVDAFPPGTDDLDYAYALYNLGRAYRLAGRPEDAIPVLEQRMEIPNQLGIVRAELDAAYADAGVEGSGDKPGEGPKKDKSGGEEEDD